MMLGSVSNNGIERVERQTARAVMKSVVPDITADAKLPPSGFIKKYWTIYQENFESNQNINGKVFEELISICLIRQGVLPFYMQAKVAFIPYVNYDFIIYTSEMGPISLSAKTSLRERWKQADLEAIALKYIHRKSESYVITMDEEAVKRRRVDSSQALGIDSFILAKTDEFDQMIDKINSQKCILSPKVEVVNSNIVITSSNFMDRYS